MGKSSTINQLITNHVHLPTLLLYQQGADQLTEAYLNHWWRWVRSGVDGVSLFGFGLVVYKALTQPTTEAYP
uniref:Uncharacterized protein n=1 Tax=Moorena producens (strain JHB) TaxID=1454205 RepID=A0A1D9G0C0_MOOP1